MPQDDVSRMSKKQLERAVRAARTELDVLRQNDAPAAIIPSEQDVALLLTTIDIAEARTRANAAYSPALLALQNAAAAVQAGAFCSNGPETRKVLSEANSELLASINRMDDTLREIDRDPYLSVDFPQYQPMLDACRELFSGVKYFLNANTDTDAEQRRLRDFLKMFNPKIIVFEKGIIAKRGTRKGKQAEMLKRIDERIHTLYAPGNGYERVVIAAANDFRHDGDTEAARYIDQRKDKRQFARDAIERQKRRLESELVCVE